MSVLLACALFVWPRSPATASPWLHRALVIGLICLLTGNVLEMVGAFGYAPDNGYEVVNRPLTTLHAIGVLFSPLGFIAVLLGSVGPLAVWAWRSFIHRPQERSPGTHGPAGLGVTPRG